MHMCYHILHARSKPKLLGEVEVFLTNKKQSIHFCGKGYQIWCPENCLWNRRKLSTEICLHTNPNNELLLFAYFSLLNTEYHWNILLYLFEKCKKNKKNQKPFTVSCTLPVLFQIIYLASVQTIEKFAILLQRFETGSD